jgi:hypothetical protein
MNAARAGGHKMRRSKGKLASRASARTARLRKKNTRIKQTQKPAVQRKWFPSSTKVSPPVVSERTLRSSQNIFADVTELIMFNHLFREDDRIITEPAALPPPTIEASPVKEVHPFLQFVQKLERLNPLR